MTCAVIGLNALPRRKGGGGGGTPKAGMKKLDEVEGCPCGAGGVSEGITADGIIDRASSLHLKDERRRDANSSVARCVETIVALSRGEGGGDTRATSSV